MAVCSTARQASLRAMFFCFLSLGPLGAAALAGQGTPGIANFYQVNEHVYRGGQPTARGFETLTKLGAKTVIDLRGGEERTREEEEAVTAAGMRYINVPMASMHAPKDEQVAEVLGFLGDPSAWPVFVHCRRGKDRTGTVIACYRIVYDGWENRKALEEATSLGMSWFQRAMRSYILRYANTRAPLFAEPLVNPLPAAH